MEYEINDLKDLLALDEDQIGRFCSELPSMIKQVKALIDSLYEVGEVIGCDSPAVKMLSPLTWIDDGKQDLTVNINSDSEESLVFKSTAK